MLPVGTLVAINSSHLKQTLKNTLVNEHVYMYIFTVWLRNCTLKPIKASLIVRNRNFLTKKLFFIPQIHVPIQHQFFQLMQITGYVFQGHVCDTRAPGQVQAAELTEVLSHQLHAIISDLRAARETEGSKVGEAVNHVDYAMISDLPTRVQT